MTGDAPQAPPADRPSPRHPTPPRIDFTAVVWSSPLAIVGTEPGGNVCSWNPAAETLFGYTAEELIGRPIHTLIPPDRHAETQTLVERMQAGESVAPYVAVRLRKDGSPIHVSVHTWPVRDATGNLIGLAAAYTDRTSQGEAEVESRRLHANLEQRVADQTRDLVTAAEGQRASEEQFRLLVEGVQDYAILMLDPDGRVTSWNAGAERITGYTAEDVLGRYFGMFHPPEGIERWQAKGDSGGARSEVEGWRFRKDGARFWASNVITPLRDAGGRLLGFSSITRDLTERKRAEDELRQRAAELEASNRELAQKNTENEMFVYSVSHDLRSPLVNLQGFSKELEKAGKGLAALFAEDVVPPGVRDRGQAILDGKVAKSIRFIQTGVLRLSGIIDALLRLSRAGRVEYRWDAVDVAQLVAQVVGAAQATITERGATVRAGSLPPTWGDRTAVEQVFGNLIGNALTYLAPGRPGVIEIGALPDNTAGVQTYFVRDNGLGIAEGHRKKIFQAFQRAHPGVGSGEGLGLAIVARVVERHRGRVWVESVPGEGSTFFVTLPVPPATAGR